MTFAARVAVKAALLVIAVAGCYRSPLSDCIIPCGAKDQCPSSFFCNHAYCTRGAVCTADAGEDFGDGNGVVDVPAKEASDGDGDAAGSDEGDTTPWSDTGNPPPPADSCAGAQKIFTEKCANDACHSTYAASVGLGGGLDLQWPVPANRLVGKTPPGTALSEKCKPENGEFLKAGSSPATGLFIDKLAKAKAEQACGDRMPQVPGPLNANELACLRAWATGVTTGAQ